MSEVGVLHMGDCAQQALRWALPSVGDDVILQPVAGWPGLDAGCWGSAACHVLHEKAAHGAGWTRCGRAAAKMLSWQDG